MFLDDAKQVFILNFSIWRPEDENRSKFGTIPHPVSHHSVALHYIVFGGVGSFKRAKSTLVGLKNQQKSIVIYVLIFKVNKSGFCSFKNYQRLQTQSNYVWEKALSLDLL